MFRQVVGSVWRMMKIYEDNWKHIKGSEMVKRYGPEKEVEPEPVSVNLEALVDRFKEGFEEFGLFWKEFLSEETFAGLTKSAESPQDSFSLPPELWVRTVFDFAVEYNFGDHNPAEVVDSMIPLYFGRTASFVVQTKDMSSAEAEKIIDHLAQVYEKEKGYLIKRWEEKKG